jgi:hypothetical protein
VLKIAHRAKLPGRAARPTRSPLLRARSRGGSSATRKMTIDGFVARGMVGAEIPHDSRVQTRRSALEGR